MLSFEKDISRSRTLKAILYTQYGSLDVLKAREVERPEPEENQVLVNVHAASANALDYRRFGKLSTLDRIMEEWSIKSIGKVLGAYTARLDEAVDASVKKFQPVSEAFALTLLFS